MSGKHWIVGIIAFWTVVLCLVLVGCSKIENPAKAPLGNGDFAGMAYEEAASAIRDAGFVNIQEATVKPVLGEAGTVKSVSIDGKTVFSKGQVWENGVPVIITYYAEELGQAEEPAPETAGQKALEVAFDIEVTGEEGKPVFVIKTNLPDDAVIGLYLVGNDLYYGEQTAIVKDGKAESTLFTNDGAALTGYSVLGITMLPADQPESVQAIIGAKGEHLTGPAVVTLDTYSYVAMEKNFGIENLPAADMEAVIESALAAGFGDRFSLSLDGTVYTANVWQDGLAATALLAKDGNADAVAVWDQIRQTTAAASERLQKLLADNGYSDKLVVVNIVNDANHENILLSVMAGTVVSDCTA